MKIRLIVILLTILSCKQQSETNFIKDYKVVGRETEKNFRFYLILDSKYVDSFYYNKYAPKNNRIQVSNDVIHDCLVSNLNVNERFIKFIIDKEGLKLSDTIKILSYIHKLTNHTYFDNLDIQWESNYKIFKQNIELKYEDRNSQEFAFYKKVFENIENNLGNKIYLLEKNGLKLNIFYSPIYSISLSESKSIEYKEITCDFSKLNAIYE